MGQSSEEIDTIPAPDRQGTTASFAEGSLIAGKYLIERTLAEGGIGIVVVAKNLALQQRVAIKYLKPKALRDKGLVDRFVREARLAARITSDHVVRVFDVGSLPDGTPFMVMEHLTGHDLGSTVDRGPSPIAEAIDYVMQACDALAEAHALGIVHRDLKPDNLFLAQRPSNTPIVKIIDFGISKVAPHRGGDGTWARETGATDRFGTPVYMSPEQLKASAGVDGRADIWSLGIVLYELLTGQLPFEGDDLPQLCTSILTSEPKRLTAARPDVPARLEAVVLRCLEKDPAKRFRNVAELVQELVPFGPALAAVRAARIREVVIAGGASVRAPMQAPGSLENSPADAVRRDRPGGSTESRVATTITVQRPPALKTWQIAIALVAVLACAAAVGAMLNRRGVTGPAAPPSVLDPRATSAAIAPVPAERVVPTSPPPPSAAPSVELPAAAATPPPSLGPRAAASPRSQNTLAAPAARPPQPTPIQPSKRRALFGDRN